MLIQLDNLSLQYGIRSLFEGANAVFTYNQKIAVIGRNGAGKSSLMKMIIGEEEPSSGKVIISRECHLSYLQQKDPYDPDDMVIDFLTSYSGKAEWECARLGAKMGLSQDDIYLPISCLSGGYQMRVKLTAMILKDPNFLILDEPTNYLDLSTLLFLEQFLQDYNGSFLLVSHDREFLRKTCTHTLEIEHGQVTLHSAPVEEYLAFKDEQLSQAENFNKNVERKKKHLQQFVDKFGSKATKASAAQSKLKQIAKLKTVDIAGPLDTVRIKMPKITPRKGVALSCEKLAIGYPDYTVATKINFDVQHGSHVAILGDNGQGKSTFLKTISDKISAKDGSFKWGYGVKVGTYAQHVFQELYEHDDVFTAIERQAVTGTTKQAILDMAGALLFRGDDTEKSISVLSGGERARVCLAGLLLSGCDVLLMDEPTNHLDVETVEALATALKQYPGTVFCISHDRTFVGTFATSIIEVRDGQVSLYDGNYDEYVYALHVRLGLNLHGHQAEPVKLGKAKNSSNDNGNAAQKKPKKKQSLGA